jgi:hypothetical protein
VRDERLGHAGAVALLVLLGLSIHWAWLAPDHLPPDDFSGYAAAIEHVRTDVALYGRVPVWCPRTNGGAPHFVSTLKERLAAPVVSRYGPVRGTKYVGVVLRVAAAVAFYLVFVHLLGSGTAALPAAVVFAYGPKATSQAAAGHLDVLFFFVLLPVVTLATVRSIQTATWGWRVLLGACMAVGLRLSPIPWQCAVVLVGALVLARPPARDGWRPPLALATGRVAWAAMLASVLVLSPLLWLALDGRHHALHPLTGGDAELAVLSARSPLVLLNRNDWLSTWIPSFVASPYARQLGDPSVAQANYLGGVVLVLVGVGLTRVGRHAGLRLYAIATGATFLVQFLLALGPWSVIGSFAEQVESPGFGVTAALWVARVLGIVLLSAGAVRWGRGGRTGASRRGALASMGAGAACLVASTAVFSWLRLVIPLWDDLRSPGHFGDTMAFPLAALFGVALVAVERSWLHTRGLRALVATGLLLAIAVDFWPTRHAFERASRRRDVLDSTTHLRRQLPDDPSLRVLVSQRFGRRAALVLAPLAIGEAQNWVRWVGSPHWSVLMDGIRRERRLRRPPILSRSARVAYVLAARGGLQARDGRRGSEQPGFVVGGGLAVHAFAWRTPYSILTVGLDDAETLGVVRLADRFAAVVSGASTIDATDPEALDAAWRIVTTAEIRGDVSEPLLAYRLLEQRTLRRDWPRLRRFLSTTRPGAVHAKRPRPETMLLRTDGGPRRSYVVVSESYHPWWRAEVDGTPAPVRRAHVALMAVSVPPGGREVRLTFEPPALLRVASLVDGVAWLGCAVWLCWATAAKLRRPSHSPSHSM